ncbi:MAG: TolC family protein [Terriglobia bacterium]|jgi:outer membrane protein TolC|nr:TolC family protein [Terriglobia bacterium]
MQMNGIKLIRHLSLALAVAISASAFAQQAPPLTKAQAVAIALEKNPFRKMALADERAANAGIGMAQSSLFPRVTFSETATDGNDAVYAFGTRLRQARFTQADFAIDRLNYPDAIGNFSSKLGGEWNIFNSFQTSREISRARNLHLAAQQALSRADQEVIYRVLDSYYGVLLAQKQVELAEQTLKTAQALVDASSSRVQAGTSVEADLLSAKFNLASRQQDLIRARSNAKLSRTRLETALGTRLAPGQLPSEPLQDRTFPETASVDEIESRALSHRPDIQAVTSQLMAQQNGVKAAQSALGPQVNLFGSWEADNPHFTGGGNNNWMAGVEVRFDLFSRDKYAKVSVEKAQLSRAEAAKQVAEDNVRLDARRAYFDYDAARQMLDVSRSAVAQAEESLRIMRDRYDSGLVTITELLRAEDADRAGRTNYWESVYKDAISYAALQLATGDLNPQSPAVTQ